MAVSTCLVSLYLLFVRQLVTGSTCSSGYFLSENKQCIACPEHCLDCDSEDYCLYCDKGYWGKVCERSCPNCMTGTSCEKTNGFCKEECTYGYSGLLCNKKCDNKCISCTRENSQNCSKCVPGRYPVPYCDNICSGCHEQNCDETGVCALRCVDGFWGHRCKQNCSQKCVYASCDRDNGTCSLRCNNNSTGLQCNETNNNIGDKNSIPLIHIIVAVAVAVTGLVGVAIACLCRRHFRKKCHQNPHPETKELLGVETDADQETIGASRRTDKLQPIKTYLQKEEGCRVIHENGVNLFDCLSKCTDILISLDDSSVSAEERKSFVSAETLQTNVETLLKNHAESWKVVLPLLVDEFPFPKSDPNERGKKEYLEQIEETFMKITSECSRGTCNKTYTKLLLYASATCINTPIYVISFDQQWHYFEPLLFHEQTERILRYITMYVCLDNLFYKVESTDRNVPPPNATGIVGMYRKCLEATPTLSISVPVELTKMPEPSKNELCKSVGEDIIKECCDFLLETKLINKEEYTSLTTKINRLEDFRRKITGSEGAFETFCKFLIKRRQKSILSPYIKNWRLFVTSCEYLSQYETLCILESATVERNVSMNNFCQACSLVETELNDTSSGIASAPGRWLRSGGKLFKGVIFGFDRDAAEGTRSAVDTMKEKIKINKIEEIKKKMHDTEFKICTEMENVEKLFQTTLNKDHKSAVGSLVINKRAVESVFHVAHSVAAGRHDTTAAAVPAAVLGPFSLVSDIDSLSEAAHNKRKGDKTDAGEVLQSMIDIVDMKCKIFNNMLRGDLEDEKRMFESFSC